MKHTLLPLFVLLLTSCSNDCEGSRKQLEVQRIEAIKNCNGSIDAINEIERQYKQRLSELKC